jgi:AcrR family transcriptional regulator
MGRPKTVETDELLRVAREVFLEGGAYGSTKEIARRAGFSEAALFKRFATKADLFAAAMAPPLPDVDAILSKARSQTDPRRSLHALARSVLAYYRTAMPRILHLITHPQVGISPFNERLGRTRPVPLDTAIADFLREQHEKGRMFVPQVQATAALLVATLHSIVLFELMGVHGGAVPDTQVNAMIDVVWSGIGPKAKNKRRRKQ